MTGHTAHARGVQPWQPTQSPSLHSRSIEVCVGDEALLVKKHEVSIIIRRKSRREHTHSHTVCSRAISERIVSIKCSFGQFQCCTNRRVKDMSIKDTVGESHVNMVHCRDDHRKIGSRAREVLGSMLEDLQCKQCQSQLV